MIEDIERHARALSEWLDCGAGELREFLKDNPGAAAGLEAEWALPEFSAFEIAMRKTVSAALSAAGPAARSAVTGVLKLARGTSAARKSSHSRDIRSTVNRVSEKSGFAIRKLNGAKSAICLTHDIDTAACYDFLPDMLREEEKRGLRSALNFITHGEYSPDPGFVREIVSRGFEVGLHGYDQDLGFAYKSGRHIRRRLEKAIRKLGVTPRGYRSHGLSFSPALLHAISELGFTHDGSFSAWNSPSGRPRGIFPFMLPGTKIREFPILIMDDILFREWNMGDGEALAYSTDTLKRAIGGGGVAVVNCHPCIARIHLSFFRSLLDFAAGAENAFVATPGKLTELLNERLMGQTDGGRSA